MITMFNLLLSYSVIKQVLIRFAFLIREINRQLSVNIMFEVDKFNGKQF